MITDNIADRKSSELSHFVALEKLRKEFKADSVSLVQSEAISILSLCDEKSKVESEEVYCISNWWSFD